MKTMEHHFLPNGTEVLFDPEEHKYFIGDKELPSITTLLQEFYGNIYSAVRPEILEAAARYGTAVHEDLANLIEMRKQSPDVPLVSEYLEVNNYFDFIEPVYGITPIMTEKVVIVYNNDNEPIAAGRFDLICDVKGKMTLADFKTTSTIHRQMVSGQLNLYRLGAYQSGYIEDKDAIDLGVIQLSGSTSKYVPMTKFGQTFFDKIFEHCAKRACVSE